MTETTPGGKRDWAGGTKSWALGWGLPIAALVAAAPLAGLAKTLVWVAALTWMGAACLGNALRCRRLHCYFTGPFFLVMALAALLHGLEMVWLGPEGWRWLGITVAVGGLALWRLPELVWGRYAGSGD